MVLSIHTTARSHQRKGSSTHNRPEKFTAQQRHTSDSGSKGSGSKTMNRINYNGTRYWLNNSFGSPHLFVPDYSTPGNPECSTMSRATSILTKKLSSEIPSPAADSPCDPCTQAKVVNQN